VLWPLEDGPELLRCYQDFAAQAPNQVATIVTLRRAPPLPLLPVELHGRPVCMITMCYLGDPAAGQRALAPLRKVGRPLLDLVDLRHYVALQALVDATVPHCWHYSWKSADLPALDDALIHALLEHAAQIRSSWSYAVLFHLGGAIAEVDQDATAYAHRHAAHTLNINAVWLPHQPGEHEVAWSQAFFSAVQPHQVGAYVNFLDRDATYRRLVALKDRHDPDNVFRLNHNIPPSTLRRGAGVPRAAGRRG
jgi:FAD/FMN-containing dehydrogenase